MLPHEQLTEAASAAGREGGALNFAPSIDATFMPEHPFDTTPAASSKAVPVILGTNKDEAALFMGRDPARRKLSEEDMRERLKGLLGERMEEILGVYRRERPNDTPWDLVVGINSEARRLAANALADRRVASGAAPTYMYFFTWESDFLGGLYKASHAMEIPFAFDNTDDVPMTGERADKHELAALMSSAWATFARNGDPNGPGLPQWPAFDSERRGTMMFDVPSRAENDPAASEERLAWKGDLSLYR